MRPEFHRIVYHKLQMTLDRVVLLCNRSEPRTAALADVHK